MKIIGQIKQFLGKTQEEIEYLKNSGNPDAARFLDKKFLISAGIFILIIIFLYYFFIIFVYHPKIKPTEEPSRNYIDNSSAANNAIAKQATTSLYSSMKSNVYSNVPSVSTAADMNKIPANYMDIKQVPVSETDNYVKVFDVVYDYFKSVSKGNYQTALLYLNKDFVAANKINADLLGKYHTNTYFAKNTFIISYVIKEGDIYTTKLFIANQDAPGVGFSIIYKLKETNGKLDISIDDLAKYAAAQ